MLSYDDCGSKKLSPTVILRDMQSTSTHLDDEPIFITTPSVPAGNNGLDNINGDLICYKNQEICDNEGRKFRLEKWVGQGHFGQVYECVFVNHQSFQTSFISTERKNDKKRYAIKISKSSNDALAQFNYESQALFYVCFVYILLAIVIGDFIFII